MSREWKPGDVARTFAGGTLARTATNRWVLLDDGHPLDLPDDSRIARALAVIDPEDREQVERLLSYYVAPFDDFVTDGRMDHMQAALREFATPTPPRPEEPTGLGAVVEDAEGRRFVRQPDGWWRSTEPCAVNWAGVNAVRVLSEGWSE